MVVYSIHDVVAGTWSFPQVSPTSASAVRDFKQLRSRPNVPASDLECVMLGTWDSLNGRLVVCDQAVLVPVDRKEANEV